MSFESSSHVSGQAALRPQPTLLARGKSGNLSGRKVENNNPRSPSSSSQLNFKKMFPGFGKPPKLSPAVMDEEAVVAHPLKRVISAPILPEQAKKDAMRHCGLIPGETNAKSQEVEQVIKEGKEEEEEVELRTGHGQEKVLSKRRSLSLCGEEEIQTALVTREEWKEYINVKKNKEKEFDKLLRQSLHLDFLRSEEEEFTFRTLNAEVCLVCKDYLLGGKKILLPNELHFEASHKVKEILLLIQKSGKLLEPVVKRLKTLENLLIEYLNNKKEKTPWAKTLGETLQDLTKEDLYESSLVGLERGKDLELFIKKVDEINHKNKNIGNIVFLALGSKDPKKVLDYLKEWANPCKETLMSLELNVNKVVNDYYLLNNIRYTQHEWTESAKPRYPIRNISIQEIFRGLIPEDNSLVMDEIKINKEYFYAKNDPIKKNISIQFQFFKALITALYKAGFDPDVTDEIVDRQVYELTILKKLDNEQYTEVGTALLPILGLLRLTTVGSWAHADTYFRKLFSGLYDAPYATRVLQGTNCDFTVVDRDNYSVRVSKNYCVYKVLENVKSTIRTPNEDRPLANIPVNWVLTYTKGLLKGILTLPEGVEITEHATKSESKYILDTIIHPKDLTDFNPAADVHGHLPPIMSCAFDKELYLSDRR